MPRNNTLQSLDGESGGHHRNEGMDIHDDDDDDDNLSSFTWLLPLLQAALCVDPVKYPVTTSSGWPCLARLKEKI